jgi:hypothetical protein
MPCVSAHHFSYNALQKNCHLSNYFCYCLSHNPQKSSLLLFFLCHVYTFSYRYFCALERVLSYCAFHALHNSFVSVPSMSCKALLVFLPCPA